MGKGRPNFITTTDRRPDKDRSQERGNVRLDQEGDRYILESRGQSISYTKVKNGWQFETKVSEGQGEVLILPNSLDDAQVKSAANLINKMMHILNQNKQEYGVGKFEVDSIRSTLQIDYPDKAWDVDVISSAQVEAIF